MSNESDQAWQKAWAPLKPPANDYLVPTRRSLFDAGRNVGLAEGFREGYRVITGVYPPPGHNPYEESA